jgi:G3E family GTPase
VEPAEVDKLEARIRQMNPAAKIYRTLDAQIALDRVLDLGGFNLERALEVDPMFLEPEYPFEWGGVYQLLAGRYDFVMQAGPDPAMNAVLLPVPSSDYSGLESAQFDAVLTFSADEHPVAPGGVLEPGNTLYQLQLPAEEMRFTVSIPADGAYALFTEHHPDEFGATLAQDGAAIAAVLGKEYKPDHEHDEAVTSVGITIPGDLNNRKLNAWLRDVLMRLGPDIFRMKGVLSIEGEDSRFVFQGVHMLFDGRADRPWGKEPRHNSLIFIGRNLNRELLVEGFRACLA